jgi:hypothetical protein
MESRFGHDFGAVRIHSDDRAAASAAAADAHAYTVGGDIVFGHGRYAPETRAGRLLLAHELTHVVQQGAAGATAGPVRLQASLGLQAQSRAGGGEPGSSRCSDDAWGKLVAAGDRALTSVDRASARLASFVSLTGGNAKPGERGRP